MNLVRFVLQGEEGGAPNVFALTQNVSFWTVVVFLSLLFVLRRWAFPPILGYAEAREKRIQASLDEARTDREAAERLLAEQKEALADARRQSQQVLTDAKQAAESVRQELLARAKTEQEELTARARDEIARERDAALESVRHEAVDLAIAAASKVLERRINAAEDRQLVTEYLSRAATGSAAQDLA